MQPIIIIAIVGVAAVTLSTGALMPQIGWFNLQGVSVNERDFSAPLSHVNVDIDVTKISRLITDASGNRHTAFFNLISECSFHTPDPGGLGPGSTVICKLTDFQQNVVAEGRADFLNGLSKSERTVINIDQTAFDLANEIQNINDIKLIVLGGDPTSHICNQLMNDICIDFDGAGAANAGGTPGRGLALGQDANTFIGAPLVLLNLNVVGPNNIDWFDSDGDGVHDLGWDSLTIDSTNPQCGSQTTNDDNEVFDNNPATDQDCIIVDISSMLRNGDGASVDLTDNQDFGGFGIPQFWFHDADGDGGYDAGEDIFISADGVLD